MARGPWQGSRDWAAALHVSCPMHPFIKYQQPSGWRGILHSNSCLEYQKITGPHWRPDRWAFAQALPQTQGLPTLGSQGPVWAPDLSFKASRHPASLASPAQRLQQSRAAWSVQWRGGVPWPKDTEPSKRKKCENDNAKPKVRHGQTDVPLRCRLRQGSLPSLGAGPYLGTDPL